MAMFNFEFGSASRSIEGFGKTLDKSSGTVKKLIMDAGLYNNLNASLHRFSMILERIDSGDGVAGALLKDQTLVREFQETLVSVRALTDDIKKNPKKYLQVKIF